jgi:hypothetical protein
MTDETVPTTHRLQFPDEESARWAANELEQGGDFLTKIARKRPSISEEEYRRRRVAYERAKARAEAAEREHPQPRTPGNVRDFYVTPDGRMFTHVGSRHEREIIELQLAVAEAKGALAEAAVLSREHWEIEAARPFPVDQAGQTLLINAMLDLVKQVGGTYRDCVYHWPEDEDLE